MKDVVLVVDDEELVREITVEMVEEAGLRHYVAADADEAIVVLESRSDITLVVTDINMTGSMDGLKLARAIRDRWPPVKIIVVSGQVNPLPTDLPSAAIFLRKPFRSAELLTAIEKLAA